MAIAGPQVVPGYWERPEETATTFRDGLMHTGDIGILDDDGWLYLVDRSKDLIIASGFKVWPREVEDVLYEHPAVREAAVIGVPDEYRGETVWGYVSMKPRGERRRGRAGRLLPRAPRRLQVPTGGARARRTPQDDLGQDRAARAARARRLLNLLPLSRGSSRSASLAPR